MLSFKSGNMIFGLPYIFIDTILNTDMSNEHTEQDNKNSELNA